MKKLLLTTSAIMLLAAPAIAADMPRPAPAPAPMESYSTPAPTVWQGFYAGLNAGGVFVTDGYATDINGYNTAGETVALGDSNGFIGGAQIGYNWQGAGNLVWGIEGDIQYLDYSAAGVSPTIGDTFYAADADMLATLRARLGVATGFGLIYATGGLAYSDLEYSVTDTSTAAPGTGTISASAKPDWGWTVGGGAEFMLNNNWSVKAEYLYVHFDGETATGVSGGTPFNFAFDDTEMHIARVGLNYKFGSM
ncbi:MAG: porin family protein [Rhodobiaceae bacterium]|nr:porin family protein [Rhodobiaceae bacterium]MCC0056982.1 porin family protein [Rhodobiaceae bacterium]